MANKQTAVSWLVEQLAMQNGSFHAIAFYNDNQDIIQQAEAMGKEQHKKTWERGSYSLLDHGSGEDFEQYYKETYESNLKI